MILDRYNFISNNNILKLLIGKKVSKIEHDNENLYFTLEDSVIKKIHFFHEQDCCENVYIENIDGELNDLIGTPLLMAEEISNAPDDMAKDHEFGEWDDSHTWTFYKFATIKGYVTIRWLGESNGYYSESVDIEIETTNKLYDGDCGNNWVCADNILIYFKRKRMINDIIFYFSQDSVVAKYKNFYSRGKDSHEALADLNFKMNRQNKNMYKNLSLDSVLSYDESITMYRIVTGACQIGTQIFLNRAKPEKKNYTIKEIIELTNGQYGSDTLKSYFGYNKQ